MHFMDMLNRYFSKEEIKSWTSIRKSGYILLPLFIYFLVHDLAEILLWAGVNRLMVKGSPQVVSFLTENAYTVQGIVNGLMILAGVAAIGTAVKSEIMKAERQAEEAENRKVKNSEIQEERQAKAENETAEVSGKKKTELIGGKVTDYAVVAVLAFSAALGLNLLFGILGITESSEGYARAANAQYGVNFLVGLFLYGILSPLAEEAVFRGVMYNRMKRCFSFLPAIILSALLFGCYHGNLVQAVYGTLLGILIAYVYEKLECFAAPVLFHAVANVSIYVMTYHNSLARINRGAGIVMIAVLSGAAAGCLLYMNRKNKAVHACDGCK